MYHSPRNVPYYMLNTQSQDKIFCSPLPDEEMPQETHGNNNIIIYVMTLIKFESHSQTRIKKVRFIKSATAKSSIQLMG